jgi:dimeric dUTPase (all-alpha-NTP-PPase superfamily)
MSTLTDIQAGIMLSLQAGMNAKVDAHWLEKKFPYLRAVVVEAAEAMEHHGWKWWKKQERDLPQLQMEVIDIWHFLLSEILLRNDGDHEQARTHLREANAPASVRHVVHFDGHALQLESMSLLSKLELLIGLSCAGRLDLVLFRSIMLDCGLSWESLYKQYVSKNVLNMFRQDHGYKNGTYQKLWHGREDNEHLVELMDSLDTSASTYPELLYQGLSRRYPGNPT